MPGDDWSDLPRGGVTVKKYAAICFALGMARGALIDALMGEMEGVKQTLDLTATARVAKALGCEESDLTIVWDEHLSAEELNRIKGFA
jgi:hypothetical protein